MKTNHKLSLGYTALILLCGAVLAIHRHFGAPSGLAMVLVALCVGLVVALCGVGTERLRHRLSLKPAVMDKGGFALLAAAGFLFLLAAGFTLLEQSVGSALRLVMAAFFAACGALTLMRLPLRDQGETAAAYSLLPIFSMAFYLLALYRANGDNPYLYRFGYEIAVVIAALVGSYFAVSGRFERTRPCLRAAVCGLGLMLVFQQLLYTLLAPVTVFSLEGFTPGAAVMLAAQGLLLVCGLFYPPAREVFPIQEEDAPAADEDDETEEEGD